MKYAFAQKLWDTVNCCAVKVIARAFINSVEVYAVQRVLRDNDHVDLSEPYIVSDHQLSSAFPAPPPAPPWHASVNTLQQRVADLETRNRVVTAQLQAMHDRLAVMDKAIAGQARKLKAHDKEFMGIKIKEDATLKPDEFTVSMDIVKESPVDKAAREFKDASEELEKAHFAVRDAEKNLDRAREYKQAKTEAKRKAYATLMVATGAPPEPSPY